MKHKTSNTQPTRIFTQIIPACDLEGQKSERKITEKKLKIFTVKVVFEKIRIYFILSQIVLLPSQLLEHFYAVLINSFENAPRNVNKINLNIFPVNCFRSVIFNLPFLVEAVDRVPPIVSKPAPTIFISGFTMLVVRVGAIFSRPTLAIELHCKVLVTHVTCYVSALLNSAIG